MANTNTGQTTTDPNAFAANTVVIVAADGRTIIGGPTYTPSTNAITANLTGNITGNVTGTIAGTVQQTVTHQADDSAITVKNGVVRLAKATAGAYTIAAPTSGTDDGCTLMITSSTAAAHVIMSSVDGFNGKGSSGTATFVAAKGSMLILVADSGHWYAMPGSSTTTGVTIA